MKWRTVTTSKLALDLIKVQKIAPPVARHAARTASFNAKGKKDKKANVHLEQPKMFTLAVPSVLLMFTLKLKMFTLAYQS